MGKLWKILLAIGGVIAGFFMLKSNVNKKEFTKKIKVNNKKLNAITKKTTKVEKEKAISKIKIKQQKNKIKAIKSKVKSIKNAKSIIDKFEKKYRK